MKAVTNPVREVSEMATTEAEKQELMSQAGASSLTATASGIALVTLGILALARVDPPLLNAIAVIVAGLALFFEGGAISARYARTLAETPAHELDAAALATGMNAGVLAGTAGVVLGILAILGLAAESLTGVAIIVFGAAVLFDYAAKAQMKALRMAGREGSETAARVALAAASATNTAAILVGIGLITLGILALAGAASSTLSSVALLSLGAYLFLDATSVAGRVFGIFAY